MCSDSLYDIGSIHEIQWGLWISRWSKNGSTHSPLFVAWITWSSNGATTGQPSPSIEALTTLSSLAAMSHELPQPSTMAFHPYSLASHSFRSQPHSQLGHTNIQLHKQFFTCWFFFLFLVPQVYNAHRNELDMKPFPLISKIYENAFDNDCVIKFEISKSKADLLIKEIMSNYLFKEKVKINSNN